MNIRLLIPFVGTILLLPECRLTPIMGDNRFYSASLHKYKVVCYLGSWANYRPGLGKFTIEDIDPHICTHLIFGFAGLGFDNRIRSLDPYLDLKENYGKGAFQRFTGLKQYNPELKTLLAIGGWNEGSVKYSRMASNSATRKIFIDSCVELLKKYDFDGLDLDWEYPANRGGKPEDKANFVALLREMKQEFNKHGLLLTAAVSAGKHTIDSAYDIPQVSQYLDLINIMCYDYHGGWETFTGHHAGLYARPDETPGNSTLNLNFSVNYWISHGAPREKIILGMGLYGRSFTLRRAENNGLFQDAPQRGPAGPYTRESGSLGYNEICEKQQREKWTVVRDPYYMAPYAFREREWVGYDDIESITLKVEYAKNMKLGGGMVWSIETDDFQGLCHGQKYPLLTAINKAFERETQPMPLPPTTRPPTTRPPTATVPMDTSTTTDKSSSSTTEKPSSSTTEKPSSSTTEKPSTSTTVMPSTSTTEMPSTSTTVKPDTFDGVNFTCRSEGLHADPVLCNVFYSCVGIGNGNFTVYKFVCPSATVFSTASKTCVFPAEGSPKCRLYILQKYAFLRPYYET
ncbi:chitinase-3-like protein 1 [Centruroides vittatus]|uniref:chitinase-3-like protein 1 n=1 Tax=Centruroides vittatus TaxID=120091 RepID=UPI00350FC28C